MTVRAKRAAKPRRRHMPPKKDPEPRLPKPAPLPEPPPAKTLPATPPLGGPNPDPDDAEDYSWVRDEESLQRELGGAS